VTDRRSTTTTTTAAAAAVAKWLGRRGHAVRSRVQDRVPLRF
jgi:cobalamin biosynthesis protein CbiD